MSIHGRPNQRPSHTTIIVNHCRSTTHPCDQFLVDPRKCLRQPNDKIERWVMVVSGNQRDSGGGDHGWWLRERKREREDLGKENKNFF